MKKMKYLLAIVLVLASIISLTSCYFISAQSMKKLKGTYKLVTYTYTPSHERKEGYTPQTYDYVNDAQYRHEDYLVITGTGNGYYVHKAANGECYVKEITLSYEYNQDDPSKVDYVIFNDSITKNGDEGGTNRLGVSKGNLNYNKAAFDFTQLFTKMPMRSEALSVKWEKVDKATDLSYVNKQIPELKYYTYNAFAKRGIYEVNSIVDVNTNDYITDNHYFVVIDTANGVTTAKSYFYKSTDAPSTPEIASVSFSSNDDFSVMTVDGVQWTLDNTMGGSYYTFTKDGLKFQMRLATNDITQGNVESYIEQKIPS